MYCFYFMNIVITPNDCFVAKKNTPHSHERRCVQRQALVSDWLQNHAIITEIKTFFWDSFWDAD